MIGIDKGVSDKLRITLQMLSTQPGGSGGDGGSEGGSGGSQSGKFAYKIITIDVPSFYSGIELINTSIPRDLNFAHTQFLVFSEELAREGLVGEFITPLIRNREIRYSLNALVSKESARDFIKAFDPYIGTNLARTVEDFKALSTNHEFFSPTTLYELYDCIKSTYHQAIAMYGAVNRGENFKEKGERWGNKYTVPGDYFAGDTPRVNGNKIEILGLALFDGDKMMGKLTGHENRILTILKGIYRRGTFTIPDPINPDYSIPIDVRQARKPDIKVEFEGSKPIIDVNIQLEGNLRDIPSRINYESVNNLQVLEMAMEQYMKDSIKKLIEKTQQLNVDVAKFGHSAVLSFGGNITEWEEYNWNAHYKEAKINTKVEFKARRTGTLIGSSPIIKSRGKE